MSKKPTFYEFLENPLAYPELFNEFISISQKTKDNLVSFLIKKFKEVALLVDVEKYSGQDVLHDGILDVQAPKIKQFYYYKAVIKLRLGVDIDENTSVEEGFAYLFLLSQDSGAGSS